MGKIKRIILCVIAAPLAILEVLCILAWVSGDHEIGLTIVLLAIPLFFVVRALRATRPQRTEKPAARRGSVSMPGGTTPSRVSYRALSAADALQVEDYAVVDVETTGLYPDKDEIIEVAAIRSIGGNVSAFSSYVKPRGSIPAEVTELTGIRNADVRSAPRITEVALELLEFVRGLPLVAHNASFDIKFLAAAFDKIGADVDMRYIDTVALARIAFPGLRNYKLATLIPELGLISGEQQHRAGSDTEATLKLFELCKEAIPRREAEEKQQRAREQLEEKAFHLNQYGMQAEADGNVEKAIGYYEDILEDKAILPNAYMRLAVIYKKQHRWEDVVRVCDAALAVLPGTPGKLCQPEEYEKRKAYALEKLGADRS